MDCPYGADPRQVNVPMKKSLTRAQRANGETWREFEHLPMDRLDDILEDMETKLNSFLQQKGVDGKMFKRDQRDKYKGHVTALFSECPRSQADRYAVEQFVAEVKSTGILFIDTEGPDERTLSHIGCTASNAKHAVTLVQFGSLFGQVIFTRPYFDCRHLHGCEHKGHRRGYCGSQGERVQRAGGVHLSALLGRA